METPFKAVKIAEDVYWIGAIHWSLRNFHGYSTPRGTTYNAFLILGDKITLVDTVKAPFREEMLSRIASIVDPSNIDYIISNHAEMDHSGCLPDIIRLVKPEKVFASTQGVAALKAHFHEDIEWTAVKDGEEIMLRSESSPKGPLTLSFMETRMLHWPDSMFSYLKEQKLLFSQDAFGMHLASHERFAEELPGWVLEQEAAKYFANILMPFSPLILKLLEKLDKQKLEVTMAAPDHGPLWRSSFPTILDNYRKWASRPASRKAVVVYDTMWESTDLMARVIGEGIASTGAQAVLLPLSGSHRSDIATEVLDAGALIVGSPTMNTQIFPTVSDAMTYLKGLKPRKLIGGTFGSYGWSGESTKHLDTILTDMGIENIGTVRSTYVPDDQTLQACRELGENIGRRLTQQPL